MCGRYQFTAEDSKEIQRIVQEVQERCGRDQFTPGDVYPSARPLYCWRLMVMSRLTCCIGAFGHPRRW